MKTHLRILLVEDNPSDAELLQTRLEKDGFTLQMERVTTWEECESALQNGVFDLVISDFSLPCFDGLAALRLVRERRPDLPFILFSGTVGEELAVQCLQNGATDYVLKDRATKLGAAIRRALQEAEERRRREQAEHRYQQIFNNAIEGICQTTPAGRFLTVNPALAAILGYASPRELMDSVTDIGRQLYARPQERALLAARLEDRGMVRGFECQVRRKDGTDIWVSISAQAIRDPQGLVTCCESTFEDITEKKKALEQSLRTHRTDCIGAIASGIAHDLNNILGPILMATELLEDEVKTPSGREVLATVRSSAQRGAELVRQILSFVRGVTGEPKVLDVKPVIQETVTLLRETFPRSITVEYVVAAGRPRILGHATQIHQVLMNLCVNARDAMPQGGRLRIEVQTVFLNRKQISARPEPVSGPFVALTVSDTGAGIPAPLLEKVFEPFFTTKGDGKGTGLGLATVMSIVKSHCGFLELASQSGQGTTVRVYLPAAAQAVAPDAAPGGWALPKAHGQLVLLVDDEVAVLEVTRTALERFGYRVLAARNGLEGLQTYQQHRHEIHAVLTDLNMPQMDGLTMIKALRNMDPQIKVICATGTSSGNELTQARELCGQALLEKPYEASVLLKALADIGQ